VRRTVDAKLSYDACNLPKRLYSVNQSGEHMVQVRTGGETTLQIVNKRLPAKTLRRNDQDSANAPKGLDFKVSTFNFSGPEGAAR
jgi:hypothetical protein